MLVDHFTRYCSLVPTASTDSDESARALFEGWINHFGLPRAVLHDRGSGFIARVLQRLFQRLGIKNLQTTSYHPQTNGKVERVNRVINAALTHMVNSRQTDWDLWMHELEFSLRTTPQTATGLCSMEMMHGYPPRLPTDVFTARPRTLLDLATK